MDNAPQPLTAEQIQRLFVVKTSTYVAPATNDATVYDRMRLSPLTQLVVDVMKWDPQVSLGMRVKASAQLKANFEIKSPVPGVKEFVEEQIRWWWTMAMPDVIDGLWNAVSGGEVVYRRRDDGRVTLSKFLPVHPTDIQVLIRDNEKAGIKVGETYLWGHESFLYVHGREFGSWAGRSELRGAYKAWVDKTESGGAEDAKKLWFYKCAFFGGGIVCPPGDRVNSDGSRTPWIDIARAVIESMRTGGVVVFEGVKDDSGNSLWELMEPRINGSASDLFANVDDCDKRITRGMGIPDDVLTQSSGTGSYAGRTIPAMAFFDAEELTLRAIFGEFRTQILDWLVWFNFQTRDYSVVPSINVEALMPSGPAQAPASSVGTQQAEGVSNG